MRGTSLAIMLAGITLGVAYSQPPAKGPSPDAKAPAGDKSTPSALEELLAKALAHSPDVQVAEAKVREAEAELRRTRLVLIQRVIEAKGTLDASRAKVAMAEATIKRVAQLARTGTISQEELLRADAEFSAAKAQLAAAEAALNALIGAIPGAAKPGVIWAWKLGEGAGGSGLVPPSQEPEIVTRPPQGAMADKIRQALDAPIKGHEFKEVALQDVIAFYRDLSNQVPFVAALGGFAEKPVTLHLTKELPLGAHLQALQDAAPFLTVFVRDYGLFFTVDNSPPDGVSYLDFWHGKSKSDGKKP